MDLNIWDIFGPHPAGSKGLDFALTLFAGGSLVLFRTAFLKKREYFPLLPLIDGAPPLPHILLQASFYLSILMFVGIALAPNPRLFSLVNGLVITLWIFLDENLWCPHLIHWTFTCFAVGFNDLTSLKVFTIALYFYGGLQKLNHNFINEGFLEFFAPLAERFGIKTSRIPNNLLRFMAVTVALTETSFGIFLMFHQLSPYVSLLVVLMHVIILLAIGPLGCNSFFGVWPWNGYCMINVIFLFYSPGDVNLFDLVFESLVTGSKPLTWFSLFFFGFLPILSFADLFHPQFSFQMHSGNFPSFQLELKGFNSKTSFPWINHKGVIELFHLAGIYGLTPCCTLKGGTALGHYLSNKFDVPILLTYWPRPGIWDGSRAAQEHLIEPDIV